MNIAVVTGASSGLGREFISYLDQCGVDEIWVNGRRKERLEALQSNVKTPIRAFVGDIGENMTIEAIGQALQDAQPVVTYLIYAAGFGSIGAAGQGNVAALRQMIQVNDTSAVAMTEVCLPYMTGRSRIAYISSVAAFQPMPYMNVYAGTKAFLYHYSRALAAELKPRHISVTAVCPYWIADTEFIGIARKHEDKPYFKRFPFASSVSAVAKEAWHDIQKGKTVSVPGWFAKLDYIGTKLLPSAWIMVLVRKLFG